MIAVRFGILHLTKLHPLTISRGTSTSSQNLIVFASDGTHEGVGECAPGVLMDEVLVPASLSRLRIALADIDLEIGPYAVFDHLVALELDPAVLAAVDTALWDLLAKRAGLPLYQLLGLPRRAVPTSVTAGINPPEVVRERADEFLARTGAKFLKVKLGNPQGVEADQAAFLAAKVAADRHGAGIRVDANGGWSLPAAIQMDAWLADHGCDYVEQPLVAGAEDALPSLFAQRRLPIYLDESVRSSRDVPRLADRCDGVNLKLMKTGGITEALRLVATARAHRLGTMIGCMGESSIAIAAGCAISALFDHIDLDSHLNLSPDPAHGLAMVDGVILPPEEAGHGARLVNEVQPA